MTTPHLHGLAMRTKAAEAVKHWHDNRYGKHSHAAQPLLNVHAAVLALPIEADHAALLAEAVKMPEIAALIAAAKKTHIYLGDAALGSLTRALQPFLALETP